MANLAWAAAVLKSLDPRLNHLFQGLELYWRSPKCSDLWYKSGQLKMTLGAGGSRAQAQEVANLAWAAAVLQRLASTFMWCQVWVVCLTFISCSVRVVRK